MLPKNVKYDDSVAYEASAIVKATPGTIFSVAGYNSKASAQFIQLHDSATLPADTAVPKIVFTVPASSNFYYDFGEIGRQCDYGIVLCNSSTGPTKTLGSADCWFNVQYVWNMTPEEKEEIINLAVERAYLGLPEVVGNLMTQFALNLERTKKLYAKYPKFKGHEDTVRSVIEMVEGKNPLLEYDQIIEKAAPEIRKRIKTMKNLDMEKITSKPDRQFESLNAPSDSPQGKIWQEEDFQ
jgi:hypothetical protein